MHQSEQRQLCVTPTPGYDEVVGRWIWQLTDSRAETLETLQDLPDALLPWRPDAQANSIGTLLYHIVIIELDWLYVEILERPDYMADPAVAALLPYDDRNEERRLTQVDADSLQAHLARMAAARELLYDALRPLDATDFYRKRQLAGYDVTPEWAIYHVIQHETEHRGTIAELRRQAELAMKI